MTTRNAVRIAIAALLIAVVAAVWFSPVRHHLNKNDLRAAVAQFRGLWYGPLILIGAYALGCVLALPASAFVVVSGFIWGWKLGGTYALAGGFLGAAASFAVARFLGEGVLAKFGKVGAMVKKQVDHAGFRSLLVLRFVPGLPFAAVNYGAGVAGVRVSDFAAATVVGLIPSNYLFAYCSDALFNGSMTEADALKKLAIVCAIMLTLIFVPQLIAKRFRSQP